MKAAILERNEVNSSQAKTKYMVELALMVAITLLMALTPLGYLKTPGLSVTLLTIPVAIAAMLLGPVGGAICGTAFGLTSFANGFTGTFAPLIPLNPVGFFIMTVVARMLEGLVTGFVFKAMRKSQAASKASFFVASLCCPLLNTLFFMSSLVVFFYNTDLIQNFVNMLGVTNPITFVVAFVGVQGAIEAAVCCVVATAVSTTLYAVFRKNQN